MKFERLRLTGFKSFCDSADFKIEPGLTGVVGPNGCGKSNLVEALRWVMGESSFKSMRGSGMDDVIFAGSGRRPSRNNAEVGLVLDNSDRRAPAAFNDSETIEVTRRIEREVGLDLSRQRPRGARPRRAASVRRRLDRRALALARPPGPDRRDHRGQTPGAPADPRRGGRHFRPPLAPPRGGARLKGAEDNLLRVDDVLKQLEAQIESLKQQARQSSRYRNLAADIRRSEALAHLIAWREARGRNSPRRARRLDADLIDVAERTRAQGEAARLQAIAAAESAGLTRGRGAPGRGAASDRAGARCAPVRGKAGQGPRSRARTAPRADRRATSSARRR